MSINVLDVQINQPLPFINFHKFITGDEKWALYDDLTRRKSWINSGQIKLRFF